MGTGIIIENKISYGAPLMKKLILEAQGLGIKITSPGRDLMTGLWMVILDGEVIAFPTKAGASGACCFVQGLIRGARTVSAWRLGVPRV